MADDTQTEDQPIAPVMPPPKAMPPKGSGFTYSTPGPANWQNPRTVAGPQDTQVQIPQNAQNFATVSGPPPEDQETVAFRKMFNSLPLDQAMKAYTAAKQFQGQRVLQTKLAAYSADGLAPDQALSKALTDAAGVGLFAGSPKDLVGMAKETATASAQKFQQDLALRKLQQDKELKLRGFQNAMTIAQARTQRPGQMTQQQTHELGILGQDKNGLQRELAQVMAMNNPDAKRIDQIHSELDKIRAKQNALVGKPEAEKKLPFKEGERIRNKKDGKMYVVKNGVPVPEGQ